MSNSDLEELVRKTVLLHNRIRSPDVTAKEVFISPAMVTVLFSGGFCYGCGVMDYVEGFAGQFKLLSGGKFELKAQKTRQITPRSFEADYFVKDRRPQF